MSPVFNEAEPEPQLIWTVLHFNVLRAASDGG